MTRRVATFLRVFAGWTVFVWVVFIRNVTRDRTHGTGFKVVHLTLAVISIGLATATFVVVSRARARARARDRDRDGDRADASAAAAVDR